MVTALEPTKGINLIPCAVGTLVVGFDLTRVVSVERGDRLGPCPEVPGSVGRIVHRGGDWVVYPLAGWLGTDPARGPGAGQVVLFETPRGRFGLAVDRVSPPPRLVGPDLASLISGVAVLDSGPLILLNPDELDPSSSPPPDRFPEGRTRAKKFDPPRSGPGPNQLLILGGRLAPTPPAGRWL